MEPSELTTQERVKLEQYEAIIEHGLRTFVDVGSALIGIREEKLYRERGATFEEYCRVQWAFTDRRARYLMNAAEVVVNIETGTTVPVLPTSERQARPLARLEPEQQQEAWAQVVEENPDGKITGAKVQAVVNKLTATPELEEKPEPSPKPHVTRNSRNNEWCTPAEFVEAARQAMQEIDLDPASNDQANETIQASTYYTETTNGLEQIWTGRVWMNPPYSSDLVSPFCKKLVYHVKQGDVPEACVLVNNATETGWFQSLLSVASCVCFPRSRIKFQDIDGNVAGSGLQGQAILYIGNCSADFETAFSQFGPILYTERIDHAVS